MAQASAPLLKARGEESSSRRRGYGAEPITAGSRHEGFHWGPAILQSMSFMAVEQGFLLSTDKWARYSIEHGNYLNDYANAVEHTFSQWDDGDPFLDNYIGHPLQGSLTGYIQVQNDPRGRRLMFSNTREYWTSRLKAMAWNAAFSTQFEIGPLGEAAIENLGGYQYRNCPTCRQVRGAGWVDLVVTPTGGFGWMIMEDMLDRYVVANVERRHGRGFLSNLLRVSLNPTRTAANILRGRSPWYRDSRDEVRVGKLKPLSGGPTSGGGK